MSLKFSKATYKSADDQLKRYYLNLFFGGGRFYVKMEILSKRSYQTMLNPSSKMGQFE